MQKIRVRVGELEQKQASVGNNSSDGIAGIEFLRSVSHPAGKRLSLETAQKFHLL